MIIEEDGRFTISGYIMSLTFIGSIVHAIVATIAVVLWSSLFTSKHVPIYMPITGVLVVFISSLVFILRTNWSKAIDSILALALVVVSVFVYGTSDLSVVESREFVIATGITAALISP